MTVSNDISPTELQPTIQHYQVALEEIEVAAPNFSEAQVIKVLLGRDAVEELLTDKSQLSEQDIIILIELD